MVIKFLLTIGLLGALLFALLQRSSTRLLKLLMVMMVVPGVFLVWFPEVTMTLAGWLGVGRGTDLITYLWIVISIVFILILHLRINSMSSTITDLTRNIAIAEAERTAPGEDGSSPADSR